MNTKTRPSRNSFRRSKGGARKNFSGRKPQGGRSFSGGRNRGRFSSSNRGNRGGGRKMPSFDPSMFINKNPVELVEEVYKPKNTFATFGLNQKILSNLNSLGLKTPTPIQDQIIPEILAGRDVVGLAETGTGKTAAFLLPLIERTIKDKKHQTLVLAPTRELAIQIQRELNSLAEGFRMFSTVCVGGVGIYGQIKQLKRPNDFIIATPGRIIDLMNRKNFDPNLVSTVVLDEADRMLDMGFINDMKKLLSATPKEKQTLFFSATMDDKTKELVHDFLRDPVVVSVKKKDVTDSIAQDVVRFENSSKFEKLLSLLSDPELKRVLVFGAMKHSVSKLAKQLNASNVLAESIHGNKTHIQRQKALAKFKSGNARVLVATDVAARGIHVDGVTHVINYDLPNTFEDYVHRIGRTGRGEKRGTALTFVSGK